MEVARGFSRALVLAFGTSSSSAALPVSSVSATHSGHVVLAGVYAAGLNRKPLPQNYAAMRVAARATVTSIQPQM